MRILVPLLAALAALAAAAPNQLERRGNCPDSPAASEATKTVDTATKPATKHTVIVDQGADTPCGAEPTLVPESKSSPAPPKVVVTDPTPTPCPRLTEGAPYLAGSQGGLDDDDKEQPYPNRTWEVPPKLARGIPLHKRLGTDATSLEREALANELTSMWVNMLAKTAPAAHELQQGKFEDVSKAAHEERPTMADAALAATTGEAEGAFPSFPWDRPVDSAFDAIRRSFDDITKGQDVPMVREMRTASLRAYRVASTLRRFRDQSNLPGLKELDERRLMLVMLADTDTWHRAVLDIKEKIKEHQAPLDRETSRMVLEATKLMDIHMFGPLSEAFVAKGFMTPRQVRATQGEFRRVLDYAVPALFVLLNEKLEPPGVAAQETQRAQALFGAGSQWFGTCRGTKDRGCISP